MKKPEEQSRCHSSDTNSPCCDTTDAACPGNASSLDPTDPLYREEPESPICPAGTARGTALIPDFKFKLPAQCPARAVPVPDLNRGP